MSGNNDIRYLTHDQVDKSKWDHCIHTAANGLIYATSFYLDHMATHWDALVLNDYEAVMPLTWNRKYGIKYLFQPFLTAQLGVFGNQLTSTLTGAFIKAIPTSFRYIDISLNSGNHLPPKTGRTILRKNYLLDLSKPYEELTTGYNENTRRNVKKAAQARCRIEKGFEVERVIQLAIQQMRSYGRESKENTDRFSKLYHSLSVNRMAVTYGVIRENELLASCVFFFSHNRAYYILVGNHPNGKSTGASHALIDAFIKDHAGETIVLDFEGSDIPSLASFYGGFGAEPETYPALKINRLPFYLKWLKS
mgnify:CR=1 FL=1